MRPPASPGSPTGPTAPLAHLLRTPDPDLLDRFPASIREAAATLVFAVLVAAIVGLGYVEGAVTLVLATPPALGLGSVAVLQATLAAGTVAGQFGLSALALGAHLAAEPDERRPDGPPVTAIVPVYRDGNVLHRSVESLLATEYDRLRVLVVAEPGDEDSQAAARRYAADPRVSLLVNDRSPGSKAGAINYAASVAETDVLAVFDADERVDPRFLSAAVAALEDHDVVQGRTLPEPTGAVETLAYYESVLLGDLSQRLLTIATGFRMAASRTVVLRRSAFEAVDGYDPAMLTEDFSFAFDCYRAHLDVAELLQYPSLIDAAHGAADWWGQRKRWMTGYVQVAHALARSCRRPTGYRTFLAPVLCLGAVLGNGLMLSLVAKALALVAHGDPVWLALPVGTLVVAALAGRVYDVVRGPLSRVGVGWLLAPAVLPLYSLAGLKAAVEYWLTWEGEWYHVAKGV